VLVAGALLVAGTVVGSDDWFPFAPMRQYAYAVDPNGGVSTHRVEGIGVDGEPVRIPWDAIDLRPAELEGRLRDPATRIENLAVVLETFRTNAPDAPPTIGIRYLRKRTQLVDYRPTPPEIIELARYEEPS
jgi:hypothetical protein